jgi:hypothetical protein
MDTLLLARPTVPLLSPLGCQKAFKLKRWLAVLDYPVVPLLSMFQRPSGLVAEPEKRQLTPTMVTGSSLNFWPAMSASFSRLLGIVP